MVDQNQLYMYLCLLLVMHVAVDTVTSNSALITVLRQEIDRYNNLLFVIQASLKDLILAIKGEVIMSEPLEEAYNAILSQKIPQRWKVLTHLFTDLESYRSHCVVSLSQTFYLLLGSGSTQEDRKSSRRD